MFLNNNNAPTFVHGVTSREHGASFLITFLYPLVFMFKTLYKVLNYI